VAERFTVEEPERGPGCAGGPAKSAERQDLVATHLSRAQQLA
jgi:hypothetical protein